VGKDLLEEKFPKEMIQRSNVRIVRGKTPKTVLTMLEKFLLKRGFGYSHFIQSAIK